MTDITIRRAEKSDTAAINALFAEMLRTIHGTSEEAGYEDGYLDRYFDGSGDVIFVAEDEGRVTAFISLQIHSDPFEYVYIDDFSVTEDHRCRGIGTTLLAEAEEYARNMGVTGIALHVEKSNLRAAGLYTRNGYRSFRDDGNRSLFTKDLPA